ncbi:MAG: GAF domain-containing sensor histidine kinase [Anaerolineae bacterium]|nr:GAF domain-containing sensor histidine kinase [Anaerolineae bacterium]
MSKESDRSMSTHTQTAETRPLSTRELARAQKIEYLGRLLEVTRLLNDTLNLEMQLELIHDASTELTETEVGSTFLRDSKTNELFFLSATGNAGDKLKRIPVPMDSSIAGWVVQNGEPAIVNDAKNDSRHFGKTDDETAFDTRSILAVPLIRRGKIIGAIEVVNKKGDRPFSDQDLELMTTLAAQAAVSIENARLFEQSDLVSEVVHELRTPMTSIIGYSKMLNMAGIPEETKKQFAETIHREANRLGKMVNDFLEWSRLESGRIRFEEEPVDMREVLEDTILIIEPQAQERGIVVEKMLHQDDLIVIGDKTRLKQVLLNLASNGVKYNRDSGRLDFIAKCQDGQLYISVRDTGVGIPPESLDKLFQRFYRVPGTENVVRGTGLGLNIAKSMVEVQGGKMLVESTVGVGTTFTIILPLAESMPPDEPLPPNESISLDESPSPDESMPAQE